MKTDLKWEDKPQYRWAKGYTDENTGDYKRWRISCKALGLPEDKWNEKDSYKLALKAWELFRAGQVLSIETIKRKMDEYHDWKVAAIETGELPPETGLLNPFRLQFGQEHVVASPGKSLKAHIDKFIESQTLRANANLISAGELDVWKFSLAHFKKWGGDKSIEDFDETAWKQWYEYLLGQVGAGECKASYAQKLLERSRRMLKSIYDDGLIEKTPRNLEKYRFDFEVAPKHFTVEQIQEILALVSDSDRAKFYLMLNCGYGQTDLSDLKKTDIDFKVGRLTRKRSKMAKRAKKSGFVVSYKLWPETIKALKKEMSKEGEFVFVTRKGNQLVSRTSKSRSDNTKHIFKTLKANYDIDGSIKMFRSTVGQWLWFNPSYRTVAQLFMGQKPDSLIAKHYAGNVVPVEDCKALIDPATEWLREKLFLKADSKE